MTRLENAGRRFVAAEQERRAALSELTAACAACPDLNAAQLAEATHLPLSGLIAIRVRLEAQEKTSAD